MNKQNKNNDTSENQSADEPVRVKVTRTRRRLYDEADEASASSVKKASPTSATKEKVTIDVAPNNDASKALSVGAERIIYRYMVAAGASGLIPVPLLDVVSTASVQLAMTRELAMHYGVAYKQNKGKAFMLSVAGGVVSSAIPRGAFASLVKAVPGLGTVLGMTLMPSACAATTYALGKVFVQHFESGGTFLTLNANSSRAVYDKAVKNAKTVQVKTD